MKRLTTLMPALVTASALVAGFAGPSATANQFTGSIAITALGVTDDNSVLANATTFSLTGAFATASTGEYATLGVVDMTPVDFNGFRFNPPVASVTPLWTFDIGSTVFSFDATSVSSSWVTDGPGIGTGEWVILGRGVASISGFDNTPGTYTVNLSDSGNLSIGFDATAAVQPSVPDGGNTVTLLGGVLTVLGLAARKFSC